MSTLAAQSYGTTVGGAVSVTELQTGYLRNQPWIDEVLRRTNEAPTFYEQLVLAGMVESGGTNLPTWYHLEQDVYVNKFGVNSAAQPAIGATQTLTVAPGYYNGQGQSIVALGMQVCYPDGSIGTITTVTRAANNDQIVVTPHSNIQLPAVAQGDILIPMANSVGEANTPTKDFLVTDVNAYDHSTQVIEWATEVTDFFCDFDQNGKLSANVQELPAPWENGTVKTWNSYMLSKWYKSKMIQWNTTLLLGTRQNNGSGVTLADPRYLDGIIPFFDSGANQFITPTGNFAYADLEIMAQAFEAAAHGAKNHQIFAGRQYWTKLNNYVISLPGQDMRQGTMNTGYDFGFKKITNIGGHNFEYSIVDDFTNPLTGLVNHGYANVALMIPKQTTTDTITGKQVKLMRMVYQEAYAGMTGGIGSGMWKWGALKGMNFRVDPEPITNTRNALEIRLHGTYGTDLRLPNFFGISR